MAKTKQQRANEKLIEAVENCDDDAFIVALRNGADVNALDEDSYSPLFEAIHNFQVQMIKGLIDAGADVNLAGPDGWTPLHQAARGGDTKILQMLLEAGASVSSFCTGHSKLIGGYPIHEASGDAVLFLVNHGADFEAKDEKGRVPLHYRAGKGDAVGIRLLLEAGAIPYPLDNEGKSPLDYLDPTSMHYKDVSEALNPVAAERDRLALAASTPRPAKADSPVGTCESCGRPAHSGRCRL